MKAGKVVKGNLIGKDSGLQPQVSRALTYSLVEVNG